MKDNKKVSTSLIFTLIVLSFILFGFMSLVYVKWSKEGLSKVYLPGDAAREINNPVDSLKIIREKDSLIDVLSKDNKRLKEMYDQKHDTVFLPVKWKFTKSDSLSH
jgi:hypothetical protein